MTGDAEATRAGPGLFFVPASRRAVPSVRRLNRRHTRFAQSLALGRPMGEWVVKVVLLGVAAWVAWSLFQPRYVFEIHVRDGRPSLRRGRVTNAFLGRVALVCQECGVARGWIGGVPRGRRVGLRFSRHFPPGLRQRLRNEWLAAG